MNQTAIPWVSFCLATYRRPAYLLKTLEAIRRQGIGDFEVIVSDNDNAASSWDVVAGFSDSRFRYYCNNENVGMVRNFNRALEHAMGEFVVMITDDDPIEPTMLAKLRELYEAHPGYGAYFGGSETDFESAEIAAVYGVSAGRNSSLADLPVGVVRTYSPEEFPRAFFANRIFRYFLWSTGMVRRDIAVQVGGMPDYGSPYLTDFAYIVLAGSVSGCATTNTVLGRQTVHDGNFGRRESAELKLALEGCRGYVADRMAHRPDWAALKPMMDRFLAKWIVRHALFLRRYFARNGLDSAQLNKALAEIFRLPYVRPFTLRYLAQAYLPFLTATYRLLRRHLRHA
jgi:glycosyltransferase involved in cell wall biosynthesis